MTNTSAPTPGTSDVYGDFLRQDAVAAGDIRNALAVVAERAAQTAPEAAARAQSILAEVQEGVEGERDKLLAALGGDVPESRVVGAFRKLRPDLKQPKEPKGPQEPQRVADARHAAAPNPMAQGAPKHPAVTDVQFHELLIMRDYLTQAIVVDTFKAIAAEDESLRPLAEEAASKAEQGANPLAEHLRGKKFDALRAAFGAKAKEMVAAEKQAKRERETATMDQLISHLDEAGVGTRGLKAVILDIARGKRRVSPAAKKDAERIVSDFGSERAFEQGSRDTLDFALSASHFDRFRRTLIQLTRRQPGSARMGDARGAEKLKKPVDDGAAAAAAESQAGEAA